MSSAFGINWKKGQQNVFNNCVVTDCVSSNEEGLERVSVDSAPNRFLALLLLRVETLLVIQWGRQYPGVTREDFIIRSEYSSLRATISADYTPKQRRAFIRANIPLSISVRFRGLSRGRGVSAPHVSVSWSECYPRLPTLKLAETSLVDAMAWNVFKYCEIVLESHQQGFLKK